MLEVLAFILFVHALDTFNTGGKKALTVVSFLWHQPILWRQLGVLWFTSIWHYPELTAWDLTAPSCKTVLTCVSQASYRLRGFPAYPCFCPTWLQILGFPQPPTKLDNDSQSSEKLTWFLFTVYYRGCNLGAAKWNRRHRARDWWGKVEVPQSSQALSGKPSSQHVHVFQLPGSTQNPVFRGLWKFRARCDWWNLWPVLVKLNL